MQRSTARSSDSATVTSTRWAARVDDLDDGTTDEDRRGDPLRAKRRSRLDVGRRPNGPPHATHPLHAHVSEQPAENEQCCAVHGCTPIALLERHGALGDRFTAVHATHVDDNDIALLQSSHSTCCICPTTERDLADGIGPTAAFRAAGIAMCDRERLACGDRPVRGGSRRSSSTSVWRRCDAARTDRASC